jgi:hypothetical protein
MRCAVVKQGEKWINVYAVIRLSYEETAVAEKRLRNLERDHGCVRTSTFQVLLAQRPFGEWGEFSKELACGRMRVGNEEVELAQAPTLAQALADLRIDYSTIRSFDSHNWPVAHFCFFPYNSAPLENDALAREAARLGYSDMHEAVNLLCGLNIRAGQSHGFHFCLSLPVFALISEIGASLKERRMEVSILRDRRLKKLKGIAIFSGPRTFAGEPPKLRVPIEKFSENTSVVGLNYDSASVRLLRVTEDDSVELKLLHPDFGEVHSRVSWSIRDLFRPSERNILFEALKFFCPEAELKLLLGSPHTKKSKKLQPEAAFELHVAWLLGCFGLSTTVLGEYEHIVASETKVRRGSVDILAASQRHKKLVLVACTIGPPKEDDFTNLLNTAEIVAREVFTGTAVSVYGLVCAGVRGLAPYKEIVEGLSGVAILDADRLELSLKLLMAGRERDFFSFLWNPVHSELKPLE